MNSPRTPEWTSAAGSTASPEASPRREEEARPSRMMSRRRLAFARAAWAVAAIVAVAIFGVNLSAYYDRLRTVCTGSTCADWQLTPENLQALEGVGLSLGFYAAYLVALAVVFAGVCLVLAAVIVWRTQDRMALFVALALVFFGTTMPQVPQTVAVAHPVLSWLSHALGFLGFASVALFTNLFPSGRFVPRWTRWAAVVWIAMAGQGVFFPGSLSNPLLSLLNTLGFMGAAGASLGALVYRYRRRADPTQRQQIKWVVFGIAAALGVALGLALLSLVFPEPRPDGPLSKLLFPSVFALALLLIPISIAVAILRYRLWDIDFIINRALVYGALTASVVGIYVLVVGYFGVLLRTGGNLLVSLIATGIVAVLFAPLRDRLQHGVDRLMYGERDEPYAVLSRLGQRLEATLAPEAVLPTIVETVKEALKLPYAAIALEKHEGSEVVAQTGKPVHEPLRLPLLYRNEPVGELLLGPRIGEEGFSSADRRLLDDLSRQAGVAAHAVRLTADLQRSRERLVTAREEERRRLRRDLHDGLGAQLAGLNVQTGVLRNLIRRDPDAADELVLELRGELRAAISDIRHLVYDLRPPALDDLGLPDALRRLAERYGAEGEGLRTRVETPEELPPLPAAVEVACYRIAQEALTNVIRHAAARSCVVRLAVEDEAVLLEVKDDGAGVSVEHIAGVGLISMRERAAELGGECNIEPASEGGTRVLVRLPLSREE
ncbi:MAG: sensor histidine kinase [Actinomycetota bacterium]|nr:sensor histidine kinase [Actinomycetota bacterium]